MLRGNWQGKPLGSGSDVWKYWDEKRAGNITEAEWEEIENGIARSFGTCMTMGTAATMMAIAEALGLSLPGASSIPAADSNHPRMATQSGRRIVDMVWEDLTIEKVLDQAAFENAIKVHMAMGGSTNAIIHVVAMAKRAGVQISLADFDRISRAVPVIANVRPSGKYLMEDFFYAGGIRALMNELRELLDLKCLTVTGKTFAGCDPSDERSDLVGARDRRAVRQPCAARRDHQAIGGGEAIAETSRAGARLRRL
jgi:dihydroxy-acid dehydratase